MVLFPAPDMPVNQTVHPLCKFLGYCVRYRAVAVQARNPAAAFQDYVLPD